MDPDSLVQLLADGRWHHVDDSGQCQAVLYSVGLTAETSADGRCRLSRPIELLDSQWIRAALQPGQPVTVDVAGTVDSTNTRLLAADAPPPGSAHVLLAEFQTAGRGRHGRNWLCPYAGGLCLSLAWQFDPVPRHPGTLSLAVGVAILRALASHGLDDTKLKWPNDILYNKRKLGGILIDVAQVNDTMQIVAGVGLNLVLTSREHAGVAQSGGLEAVAMEQINPALATRRNALATAVIGEMVAVLIEFQEKGFGPFQQEYNCADMLKGCAVHVSGPASSLDGQAIGIDDSGALLLRAGDMTHRLLSGDVRVRI